MELSVISRMRILIIDNKQSATKHLTPQLEQIGFRNIQYVESTQRALLALEKLTFDLVICAYSIKRSHDGLYFYEKLLQSKLLPSETAFVFTSHETNFEIIQSILELPADDILAKPLKVEKLYKRISRVMRRKQKFITVHDFINEEKYNAAITEVNKLLSYQSNRDLFPLALKMKGDLLLLARQYEEAKAFFTSMIKIESLAWAEHGLVKSFIALGSDDDAEKQIIALAAKRETKTMAYELLASLQIKQGAYNEALESMLIATEISPKNMRRQHIARLIARLTHDHETEFAVTQLLLRNSKNTVSETPEVYMKVVRAGIDFAMTADPSQVNEVMNATRQYLTELKRKFVNEDIQEDINIIKARMSYLENDVQKATDLVENFTRDNRKLGDESLADKAKALHEVGLKDDALALYKVIEERTQKRANYVDDQLSDIALFSQCITQERFEKEQVRLNPKELNAEGITAFRNGNFAKAFDVFSQAASIMPKNTAIALNLLHVISKLNLSGAIEEVNTHLMHSINLLEQKKLSFEQAQKYKKLRNLLNV
jgi:DNA-binding response OmpR family regulator